VENYGAAGCACDQDLVNESAFVRPTPGECSPAGDYPRELSYS